MQPYSGYYYNDGSYNQLDYKVVQGSIDSTNGFSFDAYQVYPAEKPANAFLAVKNFIAYKFPEKVDYQIFKFDGFSFSVIMDV